MRRRASELISLYWSVRVHMAIMRLVYLSSVITHTDTLDDHQTHTQHCAYRIGTDMSMVASTTSQAGVTCASSVHERATRFAYSSGISSGSVLPISRHELQAH